MIKKLLEDIIEESLEHSIENPTEQMFIEMILNNIYNFLYKSGQPIHTIAIGILRGNTFDMYYKGRVLKKYTERFGAMSYETTIAGKACELFKKEGKPYMHLFSQKKINEEFEMASNEIRELGFIEEAEALKKRAKTTIDQGIGSFLLIPLSFGREVIGIFTISSLKESDEKHILGEDIEQNFIPVAQMLGLMLYMEKISYDKAEEMARLLISSIDAKDECQATHSLNVRSMIDIFIDELSRDKELRERVESIGFKLTVDKITQLKLASLLHDIGKIFVPSKILRKGYLDKEEMLVRKMHSYLTYNILNKSKTLRDIAYIASMHHARFFIPVEKFETNFIGYPFDRVGQEKFSPESQIIALADTLNSIIRSRPDREGLSFSEGLKIIEKDDHKFHEGIKEIFLIIMRRVEKNLEKCIYLPEQDKEYRECLCLEKPDIENIKESSGQWVELYKFIDKIKYNNIGIISLTNMKDAEFLLNQKIKVENKSVRLIKIQDKHILFAIRDVPIEEGFKWLINLFNHLKNLSFKGKIAFAFISRSGRMTNIEEIYNSLTNGLNLIKNEPVHYFLNPELYNLK